MNLRDRYSGGNISRCSDQLDTVILAKKTLSRFKISSLYKRMEGPERDPGLEEDRI